MYLSTVTSTVTSEYRLLTIIFLIEKIHIKYLVHKNCLCLVSDLSSDSVKDLSQKTIVTLSAMTDSFTRSSDSRTVTPKHFASVNPVDLSYLSHSDITLSLSKTESPFSSTDSLAELKNPTYISSQFSNELEEHGRSSWVNKEMIQSISTELSYRTAPITSSKSRKEALSDSFSSAEVVTQRPSWLETTKVMMFSSPLVIVDSVLTTSQAIASKEFDVTSTSSTNIQSKTDGKRFQNLFCINHDPMHVYK